MSSRSRLLSAALWLPLLAFAASLAIQKIRTFDYWWHLRTGALIRETGAVPKVDVYTFSVPGAPWIDIHWLHQLGLDAIHSLGGHAAVVSAKAVLVLAFVGILGSIGYRRERPVVSVFALALMLLIASSRFMPRPELPSFVFLAAVLALLDRFRHRGDAWIYAVIPIQILWVNVHGLFVLGLAVCSAYLVAEICWPFLSGRGSLDAARVRRLAAVCALATLAALANPNLLDGALYPLAQFDMIGPPEDRSIFGSLIAELLPPIGGPGSIETPALGFAAALTGLSFVAMLLNWRRVHGADPLLWVAFLSVALGARRNLALFAIVAAPILVRNLNEWLVARPQRVRVQTAAALSLSLALSLLTVDVARGSFFERLGSLREPGFGVMELFYPVAAVEWIARERPPGPIAHHMADGGYLIWRLHPDYLVLSDGRLEVFGPQKFVELQVGGPQRFRALDARFGFGTVLVHHGLINSAELLWWLHVNSNWRLTFVDDVAAVFVRAPADALLGDAEVDVDAPDLFSNLDASRGLSDVVRRSARTNFYSSLRRHDRALEIWKGTLEKYPDLPQGRMVHALLLQRSGFSAAAESILRALLEEDPENATLLAQVGDLRLEDRDWVAAKELYASALALDPKLAYVVARQGAIAEVEGDTELALELYRRVLWRVPPADPLAIAAAGRMRALGGSP